MATNTTPRMDAESRSPGPVIQIHDPGEFDTLRSHGTVWHRNGYTAIATTVNGDELNFIHLENAE